MTYPKTPRCASAPRRTALVLALGVSLHAAPAAAARVLVVTENEEHQEVATVLADAGHTSVVLAINDFVVVNPSYEPPTGSDLRIASTPRLVASLDDYDVVVWVPSSSGSYIAYDPRAALNLRSFVERGGRLVIVGTGRIYTSATLGLIGALETQLMLGRSGLVSSAPSSLSIGEVDLRGAPSEKEEGGFQNCAILGAAVTPPAQRVATIGGTECASWASRRLGAGEVAFMAQADSLVWGQEPFDPSTGFGAARAALINFVSFADEVTGEPGSPTVNLATPSSPADEGPGFLVAVETDDPEGDDLTFSWDLDGNGIFGERPGAVSVGLLGVLDGPSLVAVAVQAVDAHGDTTTVRRRFFVDNVPPSIAGPEESDAVPAEVSVGELLTFVVPARDPAGAADPLAFALLEGPTGAAIDEAGRFRYVVESDDVPALTFEIEARDDDGGSTSRTFTIAVRPNHAPSTPQPISPVLGERIHERSPALITANGEDLDLDPLTYVFELDQRPTFDSVFAIASAPIPEVSGATEWTPPVELTPGSYYWRVRAHDGKVAGEPSETASFEVAAVEPAPDAGVDPPPGPSGCATARTGGGFPAGFFAIALVARRLAVRKSRCGRARGSRR